MTKLNQIIEKMAINEYKNHSFTREWKMAIIVTFVLRIVTMIISGYAAYLFFQNLFFEHSQDHVFSTVASVFCLLVLEFLTNIFLSKFFKFLFRAHPPKAIGSALAVLACFSLSFYAATNGLAMRTYQKADKTEQISRDNKTEINNIRADYNGQISEIGKQILIVNQNPQGWVDGKRSILTSSQLATIKEYNNRIFQLQQKLKAEISELEAKFKASINENKTYAEDQSSKFYKATVAIMIFQIISAGGLMFFWSQIYKDLDPEKAANEEIQDMISSIKFFAGFLLKSEIKEHLSGIQTEITKARLKPVAVNQKTEVEKPAKKTIGFTAQKTTEPLGCPNGSEITSKEKNDGKNQFVKIIKDHPDIAKQIVSIVDMSKGFISNWECLKIVETTGKSRTLARNVFNAVQAVGKENIDPLTGKIK